ncbi:MAG: hypothetical protein ABI183_14705 [Polyangiaceae bacterium]
MDQTLGPQGLGARISVYREAAITVWSGAFVDDVIAKLDDETRDVFRVGAVLPEWVPERFFTAFIDALASAVSGDLTNAAYLRWVDIVIDRGFGESRGLFTSLANPFFVLRRAQELWNSEHTTGTLVNAPLGTHSTRLTLRDHPLLGTAATRAALAESFRHIIQMTGAHEVTATHEFTSDGHLHVVIGWSEPTPADPNDA